MIVVDTNVVSELMRTEPAPGVLRWFDMQFEDDIYLTVTSEAELLAGVALMPAGRRRDDMHARVDAMLEDFRGRILPFDSAAARSYASIFATRHLAGRPIPTLDCQIAAIALVHDATVVTRNVRDFEGCGVDVVDPWDDG